ncbi:hypothetical protein PM082_024216 [Marasmius tenuissimus]|nr:hypothetical protein PM082_024216 [Marasmius tenuissimus]
MLDDDEEVNMINKIDPSLDDDAAYQSFLAKQKAVLANKAKQAKKKESQEKRKKEKATQESQNPTENSETRKSALLHTDDTNSEPPKKTKVEEIGGLQPNYQSIYTLASEASSGSSNQTNRSKSEGEDLVGGIFDDNNNKIALAMARDAKKKRAEPATLYMQAILKSEYNEVVLTNTIKLVSTNVNEINVKESPHAATPSRLSSSAPCKTVSICDLPVKSSSFTKDYLPVIFDFIGTQANQFGVSSNANLQSYVQTKWNIIFPKHLPIEKDGLRLLTRVVLSKIWEYRTRMGKNAMAIVEQDIESYGTLKER